MGEILLHTATISNIKLQRTTSSNMSSNIRIERTCEYCGQLFIARTTVTRCCSTDCAKRAYKKRKREEKIQHAAEPTNTTDNARLSDKEFLSIKDTCQLIGASRWTIYRMIEQKQIAVAKLGRRIIIRKDEINKLFIK